MNLKEMAQWLNINKGSVISVVGCGGKTTLVQKLSEVMAETFKVGVAASTKMYIPEKSIYKAMYIRNKNECVCPVKEPGVYYFSDETVPGKLHGFGAYMTAQAKNHMDMIIIEADGSRMRPLKGWAPYEPVIIEDTTVTIGVMNLKTLGEKATDGNVHRMSEFEKLTGIKAGEIVKDKHLCAMVNSSEGMFKYSKTKKVLLINHIDNKEDYNRAIQFIENNELNVDAVFIGNLILGIVELYKKPEQKKIAAVILASGRGSRMGKNKLLIDINGKPMIEYILNNVRRNSFCEYHVVSVYEDILDMAGHKFGMQCIFNEHPEYGQSQSIVLGTKKCSDICDGFMYFTGDMPALQKDTIGKLLKAFDKYNKIIVPVYDGHRGSPVIFPKKFKKQLETLTGDTGGRQIMEDNKDQIYFVEIEDAWQGMDVDTEEDLVKVKEKIVYEN